ncbi:AraC family transcriptional regulator [Flavobacteriaceae bacterium GSB9]|nr:AraC family transcriptional regulator [Flavobacteriaceae bacterium GSB9]
MNTPIVDLQIVEDAIFGACTVVSHKSAATMQHLFAFDHSYMVFDFGDMRLMSPKGKVISPPKMYIKPARDHHFFYSIKEGGFYIVLRLAPAGFYELTGRSASNFQRDFLSLSELFNPEALAGLETKLEEHLTSKQVVPLVRNFFNEHLEDTYFYPLQTVLKNIHTSQGKLVLSDLVGVCGCSTSTLARYFKMYVGMTPALYLRLVRFSNFFHKLNGPEPKLNELAFEFMYYDQSHFIRDFKRFAGIKPSDYFGDNYKMLHEALGRYIPSK